MMAISCVECTAYHQRLIVTTSLTFTQFGRKPQFLHNLQAYGEPEHATPGGSGWRLGTGLRVLEARLCGQLDKKVSAGWSSALHPSAAPHLSKPSGMCWSGLLRREK